MVVYQASIPTLNYSGLDDRPYMSPGLDVAETDELAARTVELCEVLLRLTRFQVRLLSRSPNLAHFVARGLHRRLPGAAKARVMFGLALGEFAAGLAPDPLAEQVKALTWLQDHAFRTFCLLGGGLGTAEGLEEDYLSQCESVWRLSLLDEGPR